MRSQWRATAALQIHETFYPSTSSSLHVAMLRQANFVLQVLVGLDYIHRKLDIIHTDLKPENIMLSVVTRPRRWLAPLDAAGTQSAAVQQAPTSMSLMALKTLACCQDEGVCGCVGCSSYYISESPHDGQCRRSCRRSVQFD